MKRDVCGIGRAIGGVGIAAIGVWMALTGEFGTWGVVFIMVGVFQALAYGR